MKKLRVKMMAVLLVVVMAFTGCMKEEVSVVIKPDGSGVVTINVLMDKQAILDTAAQAAGTALSESDIVSFDTEMKKQGYGIVTVDGKEYYQMSETQNFKKQEMTRYLSSDGTSGYGVADTVYMEINAGKLIKEDDSLKEMQTQAEALGMDVSMESIECTMSFEFPASIVRTTGTIDPSNPNKVSFDISMTKDTVIFATTNSSVTQESVKSLIKKSNTVATPKIKSLKANKVKKSAKTATATLKIKKVSEAKNYQVQYSLKKNFKGAKSKTTKKLTYKLTKLQKGKKYYVRVRACKENYAGQIVYSKWIKKTVKTKK